MKKLIAVLMLLFSLSGCGWPDHDDSSQQTAPQPSPQQKVLAVPYFRQLTQVWCWAATEQMVLSSIGYQYPQDYIVTATYGFPAVQTATTQQIQAGLYNLGGIATNVLGPLNFEMVKQIITANRPIILVYSGSFVGHVVVLYGFDQNGNIYINDPSYGQFIVPFGASFTYNGGGNYLYWQASIVPA